MLPDRSDYATPKVSTLGSACCQAINKYEYKHNLQALTEFFNTVTLDQIFTCENVSFVLLYL